MTMIATVGSIIIDCQPGINDFDDNNFNVMFSCYVFQKHMAIQATDVIQRCHFRHNLQTQIITIDVQ